MSPSRAVTVMSTDLCSSKLLLATRNFGIRVRFFIMELSFVRKRTQSYGLCDLLISTIYPKACGIAVDCFLKDYSILFIFKTVLGILFFVLILLGFVLQSSPASDVLVLQSSNVATYIANGDVALSVLMTTASTMGAILMTPLLTKLLAGTLVPVDAMV